MNGKDLIKYIERVYAWAVKKTGSSFKSKCIYAIASPITLINKSSP